VTDFTDAIRGGGYDSEWSSGEEDRMAEKKKKAKDLEPKRGASKIRGGNLPDDEKNISNSLNQISSAVTSIPKKGVQVYPK
jgi:hypothetical protein